MNAEGPMEGQDRQEPVFDMDVVRNFVSRLVALEQSKASIAEDIKEVYSEAKEAGLPPAYLRPLVAERADPEKRVRQEPIREFLALSHESLDAADP